MILIGFLYFVFILVLAQFVAQGQGALVKAYYIGFSMFAPVIWPLLWAYLWSPLGKAVAVRITILAHVLAACILIIFFLSLA